MRMTEDDPVQRVGIEKKRPAVAFVTFLAALDQPTVEQDTNAANFDLMARPRHLPGRAVKRETDYGTGVYRPVLAVAAASKDRDHLVERPPIDEPPGLVVSERDRLAGGYRPGVPA